MLTHVDFYYNLLFLDQNFSCIGMAKNGERVPHSKKLDNLPKQNIKKNMREKQTFLQTKPGLFVLTTQNLLIYS
jgi:hypothetical protein